MGTYFTNLSDGQSVDAARFNTPLSALDTEIETINNKIDGTTAFTPTFQAANLLAGSGDIPITFGRSGPSARFALGIDGGTNFFIRRYDGSGSLLGTPLEITRTNGLVSIGELAHTGSNLGFYGTTPTTKPTVSGSRGGNAALADLLTELASLGLITDSTT